MISAKYEYRYVYALGADTFIQVPLVPGTMLQTFVIVAYPSCISKIKAEMTDRRYLMP